MKLSIITINYNNLSGLKRTIDSVFKQSFQDYEWILIDGGSTDGCKELIEQNQEHFAFWCSEHDNGIYRAWLTTQATMSNFSTAVTGCMKITH